MLNRRLAARSLAIGPSASMTMGQRARELKRAGAAVVDFSVGEPDFNTPDHIKEAAWAALRDGETHYTPSRGYPELLEAIAERMRDTHRLRVDPQHQVLVTPGGKQAILMALLAAVDPGDEVLAPSPCWLSYGDMTRMAGGELVYVPGSAASGFVPSEEMLERRMTPRTKAIIVNSPCNPTGAVWTHAQIQGLAAVAQRHDLIVVSDETYDHIVFDGRPFTSPATLPGMAERTIVVNSLSKTYAMTGWRIGYLVGPAACVRAASVLHEHSATCVAGFVQRAGIVALRGPQECVREMVDEYQARRDLLVEGLSGAEGFGCTQVAGTFYAMMRIESLGRSSREAAAYLLERAQVVTTPGSAYGDGGEGYVRISFAVSRDILREGLGRLRHMAEETAGGGVWRGSSGGPSGVLRRG